MPESSIYSFVKEYYKLLDSLAPLEELLSFFNENSFEIIEGDMKIDSFESYANWYKETKEMFSQREHIINDINIIKKESSYKVVIDMDFKAKKSMGQSIHIKSAQIIWQIQSINYKFKIKKYEINI